MTTIYEDVLQPSPARQFVPLFDPGPEAPREGAAPTRDDRPVVVIVDDDKVFLELIQASLKPHCDSWQVLGMKTRKTPGSTFATDASTPSSPISPCPECRDSTC